MCESSMISTDAWAPMDWFQRGWVVLPRLKKSKMEMNQQSVPLIYAFV